MEAVYIPPQQAPCEPYWLALLEEGPFSPHHTVGAWEWVEAPEIPPHIWEEARQLYSEHQTLCLSIDGYNRGGLIAHWKGVECFIPASHLLDYPFPADPAAREGCFEKYLERELRLCIIEVEPIRNRILLSERQVEDCEKRRSQWPDWLRCGAICEGEITSVRPFGAFVNIGPLEGMIHISEISWGRVRHPGDFVAPGDKVKVMILNVDAATQRVGLSLKQLTENPWNSISGSLTPGDYVTGKIASIERFGIFVELLQGLEGLLHISELLTDAYSDVSALQQEYNIGQPINVCVLEIVPEEHRIALGLPGVG